MALRGPQWLRSLLHLEFFESCHQHTSEVANYFCLDCYEVACPSCSAKHDGHRLLQIRRYVLQSVVKQTELDKLVDVTGIQTYTTNSALVVFLNEKEPEPSKSKATGGSKKLPKTQKAAADGNKCEHCQKALQGGNNYCCLACKVKALERGPGLAPYLRRCTSLPTFLIAPSSPTGGCLKRSYSDVALRSGEKRQDLFICKSGSSDDVSMSGGEGGGDSAGSDMAASKKRSKSSEEEEDADLAELELPQSPTSVLRTPYSGNRRKGCPKRAPLW
eukprot:jgi/Mesen1/9479/ME000063S08928